MVSAVLVLLIVFAVAFLLGQSSWLAVACLASLLLPSPTSYVVFAVGVGALVYQLLNYRN